MSFNNSFINSTIICNEKKDVDLDALNLLASVEYSQLCRCAYKNENKHHHFIYDTNGLLPLTQLQAELTFENVVDILSSAYSLLNVLAKNELVIDNVKNAKEYIFKSDDGYKFIYIPIVHKSRIDAKDYIIKLLSVVHHKDVRLSQFVKELRKKENNEQAVSFLNAFVSSYSKHYDCSEDATSLLSDEDATSLLNDEDATSLLNANINISDEDTSLLSDEAETTLLNQSNYSDNYDTLSTGDESDRLTEFFNDESGEYETTVLSSQPVIQSQPLNREIESENSLYIIRNLNGEKITVDVTPFTIGKDSSNMDFVLNNDSVSRHHATIIYENGYYYIIDNNSTNGTTIEGIKLQPGEKGEIGDGFIISLGNESFQAHIERG